MKTGHEFGGNYIHAFFKFLDKSVCIGLHLSRFVQNCYHFWNKQVTFEFLSVVQDVRKEKRKRLFPDWRKSPKTWTTILQNRRQWEAIGFLFLSIGNHNNSTKRQPDLKYRYCMPTHDITPLYKLIYSEVSLEQDSSKTVDVYEVLPKSRGEEHFDWHVSIIRSLNKIRIGGYGSPT